MIKPYVITLAQVKAYLSISDTSKDTQIDLYIPDITDDLTRENGICNQSFLIEATADTAGTTVLSNVSGVVYDSLYIGSVIYINGEDGEIASFDEDADTITLVTALTKTATAQELLIRNFPTGAKSTVSKMVLSKINSGTITGGTGEELSGKSIGGLTLSFKDGGSVDTFGYPSSITKALKTIKRPRFK